MFPYEIESGKSRFSRTEILHLAIATVLFIAVLASWLTDGFTKLEITFLGLIAFFVLVSAAFILHEIAHKFKAQSYGCWSEFRLHPQGVFITLITLALGFGIIAPGATMIAGYPDKEGMGKIALSGPLTNLFMAGFFLIIYPIFPTIAWFGAFFNAILAVFNLLPFFVLDGKKVLEWNSYVWSAVFLLVLSLVIYMVVVLPIESLSDL